MPRRAAVLSEQALLSGAHLLAFVLFARLLTPAEWGEFGFAFALVLFVQGFQRAWITIPMIPFSAAADGWAPARAAWVARNTALVGAAVLVLALAAALSLALQLGWVSRALALAAVLSGPLLLHEMARRTAVQESRWSLLAGSGLCYAAVLGSGALAARHGPPSPWLPTLAVALAAGSATALHVLHTRLPLLTRPRDLSGSREYRHYGAWASGCHLGHAGYNFGIQALLAALAGPAAVGVFHACRTLVQPVATLASALDSIDKPRAAAALVDGGAPALRRLLCRTALVTSALALPYLALVALAADPLMAWVYGHRYDGQAAAVWWWCLVALCSLIAQPVESGLYVASRTRTLFLWRAVAAGGGLAAALVMVPRQGAVGALAAMALAFALAAGLGALSLQRLTRSTTP